MSQTLLSRIAIAAAIALGAFAVNYQRPEVSAAGPALIDPNLELRTVATGSNTPTAFAFIGANDVLVLEKQTGRVIRIIRQQPRDRARPGGEQRLGTRPARHRPPSGLSATNRSVPVLDGKPDGIDTGDPERDVRCSAIASTASPGTARP